MTKEGIKALECMGCLSATEGDVCRGGGGRGEEGAEVFGRGAWRNRIGKAIRVRRGAVEWGTVRARTKGERGGGEREGDW